MGDPAVPEHPPSLLRTTIRRSITLGRVYLLGGLIYVGVLAIAIGSEGRTAFDSAIPIVLPIFGVLASMGTLNTFTNDRIKGVFEYLLAYGLTPRALFTNFLVASLALVTLLLGIASGVVLGASLVWFGSIPWYLVGLLMLYSLPMSYASAGFSSEAGMYFAALSSPRAGLSSPIGIMPIVGMAPSLLTLVAVITVGSAIGTGAIYLVMAVGLLTTTGVVGALSVLVGRLVRPERFLSPS